MKDSDLNAIHAYQKGKCAYLAQRFVTKTDAYPTKMVRIGEEKKAPSGGRCSAGKRTASRIQILSVN
jgi:hypothetical protein